MLSTYQLTVLEISDAWQCTIPAAQEGARCPDPFSDAAPSPADEAQDPVPRREVPSVLWVIPVRLMP